MGFLIQCTTIAAVAALKRSSKSFIHDKTDILFFAGMRYRQKAPIVSQFCCKSQIEKLIPYKSWSLLLNTMFEGLEVMVKLCSETQRVYTEMERKIRQME